MIATGLIRIALVEDNVVNRNTFQQKVQHEWRKLFGTIKRDA
jgi:hypothetical protein